MRKSKIGTQCPQMWTKSKFEIGKTGNFGPLLQNLPYRSSNQSKTNDMWKGHQVLKEKICLGSEEDIEFQDGGKLLCQSQILSHISYNREFRRILLASLPRFQYPPEQMVPKIFRPTAAILNSKMAADRCIFWLISPILFGIDG